MKFSAWITLLYGLLILIGGMIGFYQAHSHPSLIAGGGSAAILLACSWGMFKNNSLAYNLALVVSLLLTLFFAYRLYTTSKFMPAGMMTIVSACVMLLLAIRRK